jgi:DNA-binding NarL/FixJ family response regulator
VIRVALADDHHVVRAGIRALLEKASDIEVVGEASDGQDALDLVELLQPDVVVMDIRMPRLDGLQALQRVRSSSPATRVVVLSMYSDKTLVRQALRAGARGYLLKGSFSEELLLAIRAAARDATYLSPDITASVVEEALASEDDPEPAGPAGPLTPREREVLQLVAEEHTNAEIAELLVISIKTVQKHRGNLMRKLGVYDREELLGVAGQLGLVFPDEQ